jgi:hypothetical protein
MKRRQGRAVMASASMGRLSNHQAAAMTAPPPGRAPNAMISRDSHDFFQPRNARQAFKGCPRCKTLSAMPAKAEEERCGTRDRGLHSA